MREALRVRWLVSRSGHYVVPVLVPQGRRSRVPRWRAYVCPPPSCPQRGVCRPPR